MQEVRYLREKLDSMRDCVRAWQIRHLVPEGPSMNNKNSPKYAFDTAVYKSFQNGKDTKINKDL